MCLLCDLTSLLFSQWQTEIERFAPFLKVMVLHNEESVSSEAIAAHDVVLTTNFVFQSKVGKKAKIRLSSYIKRIHWHRILVDESHMGESKFALATLSATHRHLVSGTPLGSKISDVYPQVRFLRVAPFHRPEFWKNQVEEL